MICMTKTAPLATCVAFLLLGSGCEAVFTDLRFEDAGFELTVDPLLGRFDDDVFDREAPLREEVVFSGQFERVDYTAEGSAEIVHLPDGSYEVRLGEDFFNAPIPGPVLVLSLEPVIGSRIEPERGDIEIAALTELSGAQTFKLPFAPGPRRHLWVYCKPFGLESSLALLGEPGDQ